MSNVIPLRPEINIEAPLPKAPAHQHDKPTDLRRQVYEAVSGAIQEYRHDRERRREMCQKAGASVRRALDEIQEKRERREQWRRGRAGNVVNLGARRTGRAT